MHWDTTADNTTGLSSRNISQHILYYVLALIALVTDYVSLQLDTKHPNNILLGIALSLKLFINMMDDCCAPQWADFMSSAHLPSDSYFETVHEVHEPQANFKSVKSRMSMLGKVKDLSDITITDLDSNSDNCIPKRTPIKIYSVAQSCKSQDMLESTETDLCKRTKDLQLNGSSCQMLNMPAMPHHQPKTPVTIHKFRASTAEKPRRSIRLMEGNNTICGQLSFKDTDMSCSFQINEETIDTTKDNNDADYTSEGEHSLDRTQIKANKERLSFKVVSAKRRESILVCRSSMRKKKPTVLTSQYHRRSLDKNGPRSKQFVSLAEIVSKFQNGTPPRFRTINNKGGPLGRVKADPPKLTAPISPALRCKHRARATKYLSQQVRELLELEERKKNSIKANPVPTNILKGPVSLKKVPKKPPTVTEAFRLTMTKKQRHTTVGPVVSSQNPIGGKPEHPKATLSRAPSTASNNAAKTTDNACTVQPSKARRTVTTHPFSFEQRDKTLAKKKEERVKQLENENKKARVFHATPMPSCILQDYNAKIKVHQKKPAKSRDVAVKLNTETRARERCAFGEKLRRKELDHETRRQEEEKNRLALNKLEKKALRKMTETKATPMPVYKPLTVVKSKKPVTVPKSPAFASKLVQKHV